jgi:hypothetical protein
MVEWLLSSACPTWRRVTDVGNTWQRGLAGRKAAGLQSTALEAHADAAAPRRRGRLLWPQPCHELRSHLEVNVLVAMITCGKAAAGSTISTIAACSLLALACPLPL